MHHFVLAPQGSAGAQGEVVVGSWRWVIAAQEEMYGQEAAEVQGAERKFDWDVGTRERQGTWGHKAQVQVRLPLRG